MPILVTTSGPLNDATITAEYTFGSLAAAIADDIDDTTGEYASQINTAILSAIRFCERNPFYFNETRDITFPTIQGKEWYDASDNPNITTLVHISAVYSEDARGQRTWLNRFTPEHIEIMSDNSASQGEPYAYTYFGRRIRLYPVPAAYTYTIRLQVGPYRLNTITNATDSNAWLTEAYDMIKARAKYILAKDTLKDAPVAAEALNDFQEQFDELKAETSRRNARGIIVSTVF